MAERKSIGWLPIAIGSVVLVLIVALVLMSVGMLPVTSGGIDFAFNPLTTTRNADGSYTAEVEVIKNDQWSWNELDAEGSIVSPQHKDAEVRLVSELPSDPVPERFVLKFQIDEIDREGEGEAVGLRVKLRVKASKHGGLSGGSRSKSELVALEPPHNIAVQANKATNSEGG